MLRLPLHGFGLQSFLLLAAYLVPVLISQPGRIRITACACKVEPEERQRGTLLNASPAAVHTRKNILSIDKTLMSGLTIPVKSMREILRQAKPVIIHRPDGKLREGIPLLRKRLDQRYCFYISAAAEKRNTFVIVV